MAQISAQKCKQNEKMAKSDTAFAVTGRLAEVHGHIKYILPRNKYIIDISICSAHSID